MVRAAAWICSCEIALCELEGSDFAVGEIELINVLNDPMCAIQELSVIGKSNPGDRC